MNFILYCIATKLTNINKEEAAMPMADRKVRQRLYKEYKELDNQYRKLIGVGR